jgi:hypothetical protein
MPGTGRREMLVDKTRAESRALGLRHRLRTGQLTRAARLLTAGCGDHSLTRMILASPECTASNVFRIPVFVFA